jgi:hypothetical protein
MRLIAFGSSHTTGYRLKDIINNPWHDAISQYAYPQIAANLLNCECINKARTGNGIDQIYTDVFGFLPESQPDDIFVIHLPVNPSWFKLITSDNEAVNIVKPDSLNFKGRKFKQALHYYYGVLAGENHFNRLWYINFYSLISLLHFHNKKYVWFFDSYSILHEEFPDIIKVMPEWSAREIEKLKLATPDPTQSYLETRFADCLSWHLPTSLKECGHHDEIGHQFWAENILVPFIKERLTQ